MPFKNPHPLYTVWQGMRRRCRNPNSPSWKDYGGRGIKICPEWDSFSQFVKDMGDRPSPHHSIDRIDNNGDYTPSNCRWANWRQQNRNQRNNRRVVIEGIEYLAVELSEKCGLKSDTIIARAEKGMSYDEVMSTKRLPSGNVEKAVRNRVRNQLARTHCKNGHPWTPENTGKQKTGRYCRTCHRLKTARQWREKQASAC